jgi:predicted transglutaminase-like cysteine proteinase
LITEFQSDGNIIVAAIGKNSCKDGKLRINKTQYLEGIPEAVYNFHIGGYQVCQKWLKDRKGRELTEEEIEQYQKVVVALNETIRIMKEIDAVIEGHGG